MNFARLGNEMSRDETRRFGDALLSARGLVEAVDAVADEQRFIEL